MPLSGLRDYLALFCLGGIRWKDVTTAKTRSMPSSAEGAELRAETKYLYSNSASFASPGS
jgi:hypothetical protein